MQFSFDMLTPGPFILLYHYLISIMQHSDIYRPVDKIIIIYFLVYGCLSIVHVLRNGLEFGTLLIKVLKKLLGW